MEESMIILSLLPDSLHYAWDKDLCILDYGTLRKVVEVKMHVCIYIDEIQALIVPKRAFADMCVQKKFLVTLDEK